MQARLEAWLRQALVDVEIHPDTDGQWRVMVTNGEGGHNAAAAMIARCPSDLEAELVAEALRRMAG